MSNSGITPINSGPLLIRTYLDDSPEDTYLLTQYDVAASTQSILITSTNGIVTISHSINVSSANVSSLIGNTVIAPMMTAITMNTSSLSTNTAILSSTLFSTMNVLSTITTSTSYVSSLLNINNTSTTSSIFQTISGYSLITEKLSSSTLLYGVADAFLGNTLFNYLIISSNMTVSSTSSIYTSSNIISTTSYLFNTFSSNSIIGPSISCSLLSSNHSIILRNNTNALTYYSTIYCSTISTSNFSYNTFLASGIYDAFNTITVYGSSMLFSTINCTNLFNSTLNVISLITDQLPLSYGTYSTMNGNTLTLSTILISSLFISSLYGSTIIGSTLSISTAYHSTLITSTLNAAQLTTLSLSVSSFIGDRESISTLTTSTLTISSLLGSTIVGTTTTISSGNISTLYGSTLTYTTTNGSSIITPQLYGSTASFSSTISQTTYIAILNVSSITISTINGSTISISTSNHVMSNVSSLSISTSGIFILSTSSIACSSIILSTLSISTLLASTMLYSSLTITTANICTLTTSTCNTLRVTTGNNNTNTGIGYQSLLNNTGTNNTSLGYTSLMNNTSGSYNTGLGVQTLYYNTTGSYNTGIGYNAGFYPGFIGNNNLYIGYNAYPSGANVSNEIVIGGSYNASYSNNGNGSNTVTIGNSATNNTILYGNVGINTLSPGATMDVRGSAQIMGGNMNITNPLANYSSLTSIYSDNSSVGMTLMLNGSLRYPDGGPGAGTLRNNYGSLRLQAIGGNGITILSNGNIGIGNNTPTVTLDITGSTNISGTLYTSSLNFTNSLQHNGATIATISQWSGTNPIYYTTGKVGIQTTTPTYTLDVNGKGILTGAYVTSTITSNSLTCTAVNTQNNTLTCNSINTNGANINCTSFSAGTGNIRDLSPIICNNLITNKINDIPVTTSLPPATFRYNVPLGIGGWSLDCDIPNRDPYNLFDNPRNVGTYSLDFLCFVKFRITYYLYYILPEGNWGGPRVSWSVQDNSWAFSSDRRIKDNICSIEPSLYNILKLCPVTYFAMGDSNNILQAGLIAQDVQPIFPLAVSETTLNQNSMYDSPLLGIQYTTILLYLINAFQEQHRFVQQQQSKLSDISSNIKKQKQLVIIKKIKLEEYKRTIELHNKRILSLHVIYNKLQNIK